MTTKKQPRRGLGGGVEALFKPSDMESFRAGVNEKGELVAEIDVALIRANKDQPRKHFDDDKIRALADSIDQYGLLQPIVLKRSGAEFDLIAGERRLRAVKLLGKKKIRALIHNADEEMVAQLALMENLQREDLTPMEEAKAYDYLIRQYKITQDQVSKIAGKSRAQVANMLRLLQLEEEIQETLETRDLSIGQAKLLLSVKSSKERLALHRKILDEGLTVRQIEEALTAMSTPAKRSNPASKKSSSSSKSKPAHQDVELLNVTDRLMDVLGTKVQIMDRNGTGSIVIDYYSEEELERLVELLFHVEQ